MSTSEDRHRGGRVSGACQACGNPSRAGLDTECRNDLTDALLDLAEGITEHGERRPPSLVAALSDVVGRRTHTKPRGGGSGAMRAKGGASPLPVNMKAARMARRVDDTVRHWVVQFVRLYPAVPFTLTGTEGAAALLAGHPHLLARMPDAGRMHGEITRLVKRVRSMVDLPVEGVFVGPCPGTTGDGTVCGADLYTRPGRDHITCRDCRTRHDVQETRDRLAASIDNQLCTLVEMSRVIPALLGEEIKFRSLQTWARNGELGEHPPLPGEAAPRYRVGEVRALAQSKATRDRKRKAA